MRSHRHGHRQRINTGSAQDISSGTLPLSDKEISVSSPGAAEELRPPYRIQQLDGFGGEPPTHSCHLLGSAGHGAGFTQNQHISNHALYPCPPGVYSKGGEIKGFFLFFCFVLVFSFQTASV